MYPDFVPSAFTPWITLGVALVVAWVVHAVLWSVVIRLIGGRTQTVFGVIRRLRVPSRLLFWDIAIGVVGPQVGFGPEASAVLAQVSAAIAVLIIGWIALIAVDVVARRSTASLKLDAEDNLAARKQVTQVRLLQQAAKVVLILLTGALVLSMFDAVRSFGVSLLASAGAAGLILGYAATPVLKNLIAGVQIALTQPIRIDDVVIVEGEWGWVEEIASTYVVVRIWDLRRLVVPLSYFIEQPFQNWTRESASILGAVFWYVDYTLPVEAMRAKFEELVRANPKWDGKVVGLQVTNTDKDTVELRGLVSARNSPIAWDLRCELREQMIDWMQKSYPEALPRTRADIISKTAQA